jgi:ABC transporter fused permease/ATP-binding protein
MSRGRFASRLEPSDEDGATRIPVARLVELARPELRRLALGTVCLLVGGGMTLLYPQAIRIVIDGAVDGGMRTVNRAALLMAGVFIVQAVAIAGRSYLFNVAGERIVTSLRERLYRNLIVQEIAFFDQRRTGELISRLASDTTVLQNTASINLAMGLRAVVMAVGGVALLLVTSWRLTLVMLAIVPPIAIGSVVLGRRISRLSRTAQDALARASEVAEETIAGVRTVQSFTREPAESARYTSAVWDAFALARQRVQVVAAVIGGMVLTGYGALACVLWFGGRLVVGGRMTVGELTAFTLYTVFVAFALSTLADLWSDLMRAGGASHRVFELLERTPDLARGGDLRPASIDGRVQFADVSFAYPTRPEVVVLDGIDLVLEPGTVTALVGPSGAGKSTLSALIPRLYDPAVGAVRLDGLDVRDYDLEWLRQQIGIVAQEPMLFSTTIEDNIRYGRADASGDEIEAAARAAHAHDFVVSLPDGFRTQVGERGIQLSGGQKQRVAIARALLKDPPILILDEATSSLDAESEALVRDALDRLMRDRTSLVIAHRLSTVRNADRVVVLDGGRVLEAGTHDRLMGTDGVYRRLVRHQLVEA